MFSEQFVRLPDAQRRFGGTSDRPASMADSRGEEVRCTAKRGRSSRLPEQMVEFFDGRFEKPRTRGRHQMGHNRPPAKSVDTSANRMNLKNFQTLRCRIAGCIGTKVLGFARLTLTYSLGSKRPTASFGG